MSFWCLNKRSLIKQHNKQVIGFNKVKTSHCSYKKLAEEYNFETGDILLFDWKVCHFSKTNAKNNFGPNFSHVKSSTSISIDFPSELVKVLFTVSGFLPI